MTTLYDPILFGDLALANRIFMAPLTRNRALPDGMPGPWASEYYAQRASAGLIITEATQISPMGKGYFNTSGIHSDDQTAGWARVTHAVHAAGGKIFLQLWHVGRISHSSLLPGNASPVAPSAIRARTQTALATGLVEVSEPRQLTVQEIAAIVEDYREASRRAKIAGFDGIEIHAANGYLIDQFIRSGSNRRTDEYGGSAINRVRFLREVTESVLSEWDPQRVGVRLSPFSSFNDMKCDDPEDTFLTAIESLNDLHPIYLHVVEEMSRDGGSSEERALFAKLRNNWNGLYIANGEYDAQKGEAAISRQDADAISYGKLFLANPDLPRRLKQREPLNQPDRSTFYGGTEKGYTDYPTLSDPVGSPQ